MINDFHWSLYWYRNQHIQYPYFRPLLAILCIRAQGMAMEIQCQIHFLSPEIQLYENKIHRLSAILNPWLELERTLCSNFEITNIDQQKKINSYVWDNKCQIFISFYQLKRNDWRLKIIEVFFLSVLSLRVSAENIKINYPFRWWISW